MDIQSILKNQIEQLENQLTDDNDNQQVISQTLDNQFNQNWDQNFSIGSDYHDDGVQSLNGNDFLPGQLTQEDRKLLKLDQLDFINTLDGNQSKIFNQAKNNLAQLNNKYSTQQLRKQIDLHFLQSSSSNQYDEIQEKLYRVTGGTQFNPNPVFIKYWNQDDFQATQENTLLSPDQFQVNLSVNSRKHFNIHNSPLLVIVKSTNNLVPNYGKSQYEQIKLTQPGVNHTEGYISSHWHQFVNSSFGNLQLNQEQRQQLYQSHKYQQYDQQILETPIINKRDPEIASLQSQILCAQQTQQLNPAVDNEEQAINTLEFLDVRWGTADFGNSLGTIQSEQNSIKSGQASQQFLSINSQIYQNRQSFGGIDDFQPSKQSSLEKKSKFFKETLEGNQIQEEHQQQSMSQSFQILEDYNPVDRQSIRTYNQVVKRQSKDYIDSLYNLAKQLRRNTQQQQLQEQVNELKFEEDIAHDIWQPADEIPEENDFEEEEEEEEEEQNQENLMNQGLILQTSQAEKDATLNNNNFMSQDEKNVPFNYSSVLHQGFLTNSRHTQSPSLIIDQQQMDVKNDSIWTEGEILLENNAKKTVTQNKCVIQQTIENSQRSFDHDKRVQNILHKDLQPQEQEFLMNDSSLAKDFSSVENQSDAERFFMKKSNTFKDNTSNKRELATQEIKKLCHYEQLQRQNKKLLDQLALQREESFNLEKKVREQNKDISKLNIQIIELTRKNQDVNFRLQESKKYHMKQNDQLQHINHENQKLQTEIKLLSQQNTHLSNKVDTTQQSLQRQSRLLRALLSFLERSEGQSSNYNAVMRTLENKFEQILSQKSVTGNQSNQIQIQQQERAFHQSLNFQRTSPNQKLKTDKKIKKETSYFSRTLTPPPPSQSRPTSTLLSNFINSKAFQKKQGYPSNLQSLRSFNQSKLLANSSYVKSKENLNHTHGEFWKNIMNKVVQRPNTSVQNYLNSSKDEILNHKDNDTTSSKQNNQIKVVDYRKSPTLQKSSQTRKLGLKKNQKKIVSEYRNNLGNAGSPSDIGGTMLTDRSEKELGNSTSFFVKQETGSQHSLGNQSARNAVGFYTQVSQKSPYSRVNNRSEKKKSKNMIQSLASTSGKKRKLNYSDFSQTESLQSGECNKSQSTTSGIKESCTSHIHKAKLLQKNLKDCLKSMIIKGKSTGGPLLRSQQAAPKSNRTSQYKKEFF